MRANRLWASRSAGAGPPATAQGNREKIKKAKEARTTHRSGPRQSARRPGTDGVFDEIVVEGLARLSQIACWPTHLCQRNECRMPEGSGLERTEVRRTAADGRKGRRTECRTPEGSGLERTTITDSNFHRNDEQRGTLGSRRTYYATRSLFNGLLAVGWRRQPGTRCGAAAGVGASVARCEEKRVPI
jgi:hypothetical protein